MVSYVVSCHCLKLLLWSLSMVMCYCLYIIIVMVVVMKCHCLLSLLSSFATVYGHLSWLPFVIVRGHCYDHHDGHYCQLLGQTRHK